MIAMSVEMWQSSLSRASCIVLNVISNERRCYMSERKMNEWEKIIDEEIQEFHYKIEEDSVNDRGFTTQWEHLYEDEKMYRAELFWTYKLTGINKAFI